MNTPTIELTTDYFINKFSAVPDDKWIANGNLQDKDDPTKGCALFHLGIKWENDSESSRMEVKALAGLLRNNLKKIAETHPIAEKICEKIKEGHEEAKELVDIDDSMIYVFNDGSPKYNLHPKESILMALRAI